MKKIPIKVDSHFSNRTEQKLVPRLYKDTGSTIGDDCSTIVYWLSTICDKGIA